MKVNHQNTPSVCCRSLHISKPAVGTRVCSPLVQTHGSRCSTKGIYTRYLYQTMFLIHRWTPTGLISCLVNCQHYQTNSELADLFSESKISLRLLTRQPRGHARRRAGNDVISWKEKTSNQTLLSPGSAFTLNL